MVHLYELRNTDNQVEYVGVSSNTNFRLYQHTKCKPNGTSNGKFYGRTDLTLYTIETYLTRKEAMQAETLHKVQLGFEPTELNNVTLQGKLNGKANGKLTCKLTLLEAQEAKNLYATGNHTYKILSEKYNVSPLTIWRIVKNITYND